MYVTYDGNQTYLIGDDFVGAIKSRFSPKSEGQFTATRGNYTLSGVFRASIPCSKSEPALRKALADEGFRVTSCKYYNVD